MLELEETLHIQVFVLRSFQVAPWSPEAAITVTPLDAKIAASVLNEVIILELVSCEQHHRQHSAAWQVRSLTFSGEAKEMELD